MKIWGNQSAIKEMMKLLDENFVPPFICRCSRYGATDTSTHVLTCQEMSDEFEIYEVDYRDGKINHAKRLHRYSNNLLDGCVR